MNDDVVFLIRKYKHTVLPLLLMIMLLVLGFILKNSLVVFLSWNVALAYSAYALSFGLKCFANKAHIILKYNLIVIWLLLFPNTMYIFTDFIHLEHYTFWAASNHGYVFDIESWLVLFSILIAAGYSGYLGIKSIKDMICILHIKKKIYQLIFVEMVFLLSGFAIYIGRFIRLNSWDILKIFSYMDHLTHAFTWIFMLGFMCIMNLLYVLFNDKTLQTIL